MIIISLIDLIVPVYGLGLFGTLGILSIDHLTSSAVKSLPSLNLTPFLSLNSQVVAFSDFQEIAKSGIFLEFSFFPTMNPYIWAL